MRRPWWFPVKDLTQHVLPYSTCFVLFVLAAVYGSALIDVASRAIGSKFVLHVLRFLEYAFVVGDAVFLLMHLIKHLWESFERIR